MAFPSWSRCRRFAWIAAFAAMAVACADAAESDTGVPNPASVYCVEQGGEVEIISDADGSQRGVCRWPDGQSCDKWALYQGSCTRNGSE